MVANWSPKSDFIIRLGILKYRTLILLAILIKMKE
jgi:hypothetical protein